MKKLFPLTLVAASLLVVGCNSNNDDKVVVEPTACEAAESCSKFTILHTNDNHGRFWNEKGEYGMAARKTLIDDIKAEVEANGGEVLVLSGGDINTGVPESDLQDAVPDFIGMNLIGYDAMAVGNHEFDNPLTTLELQRKIATFPMLAANIYHIVDGEKVRYFEPYKIFEMNGLRVAIVGLTTEQTASLGNPEFVKDLTFEDPKKEIKEVIAEIKANDTADVIFATTHMGHYADGDYGSNTPGDVALARSLDEGQLQAIIGGHSQNPVCMEPGKPNEYSGIPNRNDPNKIDYIPGTICVPDQQKGTYIMQAHEWGKYVGRADFEYYGDELHLASYKLVPVNLIQRDGRDFAKDEDGNNVYVDKKLAENESVMAQLKPYQDAGYELTKEVIGTLNGVFEGTRNVVRYEQTNLGKFIASAQSNDVRIKADFGIINSGGIRSSITPEEITGNITYRDILTTQPYGNVVSKITMPGTELVKYLGVLATKTRGAGAYAHFNDIKMSINCTAENLDQAVTINEISGVAFDSTKTYSFTIPSYGASGGDEYPVLDSTKTTYSGLTRTDTGLVDADLLYEFFKTTGAINAADYAVIDGDLVYNNSASSKGCEKIKEASE